MSDKIYACQVARYEGWSKLTIPITHEVEAYPDTIARVHCATGATEAQARQKLANVVGGWCKRNRFSTSFTCEKQTEQGTVTMYENPSFCFRLKLLLKGLFS